MRGFKEEQTIEKEFYYGMVLDLEEVSLHVAGKP